MKGAEKKCAHPRQENKSKRIPVCQVGVEEVKEENDLRKKGKKFGEREKF